MKDDLIVVFGGSGFVGTHVVRALAKQGKRIRVAVRRPHLAFELPVLGAVGQIQVVQANVRFPDSVAAALEGADGVVNLIGVLSDRGKQNFAALHVEGARTIADAAAAHGVKRFVQISALGAAEKGGARYARTKFAGEQAVRAAVPEAVMLRPSIIFGPGDGFFNRFANMAKFLPFLPLFGGGKTRIQPVFVGDVADAVVAALDRPDAKGLVFELGGPRVYTFKQLLQFILAEIDRPRPLLSIPFFIAQPLATLAGWAFQLLPIEPPLTGDQVLMLKRDNAVGLDPNAGTIADLGIAPLESVEAVVPSYLWRFRPYGQFQTRQNPA